MKLAALACLALGLAAGLAQAQSRQYQLERSVHCTARPACDRAGASCKGVEKTYTGAAAGKAKDSIVRACVEANRPDRCNCIQNCRPAARCE